MTVRKEVMRSGAEGGFTNATDAADYLVKKDWPLEMPMKLLENSYSIVSTITPTLANCLCQSIKISHHSLKKIFLMPYHWIHASTNVRSLVVLQKNRWKKSIHTPQHTYVTIQVFNLITHCLSSYNSNKQSDYRLNIYSRSFFIYVLSKSLLVVAL